MVREPFTEVVQARLSVEQVEQIDRFVLLHRDLWENRSHFVRSAVIKQLNALKLIE